MAHKFESTTASSAARDESGSALLKVGIKGSIRRPSPPAPSNRPDDEDGGIETPLNGRGAEGWLNRPKKKLSPNSIMQEPTAVAEEAKRHLPELPFSQKTPDTSDELNATARKALDVAAQTEADASPRDVLASQRAQDALYEAARRRWESQRRRRLDAQDAPVIYGDESESPTPTPDSSSCGQDEPGFDVVTELGTTSEEISNRNEGAAASSDVPLSDTAREALELRSRRGEPSFDVVAFEECIDVDGHQTYIVVAPSDAFERCRSARNRHTHAPILRSNHIAEGVNDTEKSHVEEKLAVRTAQHDGPARKPRFSAVYEGRVDMPQSMHGTEEEEYMNIGEVDSTASGSINQGKARRTTLPTTNHNEDDPSSPRVCTNTRTKLNRYWKGLHNPRNKASSFPSMEDSPSSGKRRVFSYKKKKSVGSASSGVSTISSADEGAVQTPKSTQFGSSTQTLDVLEEEPALVALGTCDTTRVNDLRWEDSASNGKLHGLFSGPIDDHFQPHGEGTLKVEGTKFLFHGRWVHGRLVTPLMNDDEKKDQEGAGYVLECKEERRLSSIESEGSSRRMGGPPTRSPSPMKKPSKGPQRSRKYALGEVARTPRDMVICRSNDKAIRAASKLKKYDQAFLKRSNGLWSCSVLADRGLQPTDAPSFRWYTKDEVDQREMELEESMLFVINEDGATKIVKQRHWGKFIRCVQSEKDE